MEAHRNSAHYSRGRKFTSYKLIVDPELVKGALKSYRYDGVIPGDTSSPSIVVRDPRKQRNVVSRTEPLWLPVPTFEIDENYVGVIPPKDITLTNLNDNVSESFLRSICLKFGIVEDVQIFLHPISHRHLGFGHATFKTYRDAKSCVKKLNGTLMMGKRINVFHDPDGKRVKELFVEATTLKPGSRKIREVNDNSLGQTNISNLSVVGSSHFNAANQTSLKSTIKMYDHVTEAIECFSNSNPHNDGPCIPSATTQDRALCVQPNKEARYGIEEKVSGHEFTNAMSCVKNENCKYGYTAENSSCSDTLTCLTISHSSPNIQENSSQCAIVNCEVDVNAPCDKEYEELELSPRIDLDKRIAMMLEGNSSTEFGKVLADCNISTYGSDGESEKGASSFKRRRFNLDKAIEGLWDSESEEDLCKPTSSEKRLKRSFLPGVDHAKLQFSASSDQASKHHFSIMTSPPPTCSPIFGAKSNQENVENDKSRYICSTTLPPDDAAYSRIRHARFIPESRGAPNSLIRLENNKDYSVNSSDNQNQTVMEGSYHQNQGNRLNTSQEFHSRSTVQQPTASVNEDCVNSNILVKIVTGIMIDDLKEVLRRDLNRKFIEMEAFRMYDDWWEKQAKEFKRRQDEENAKSLPTCTLSSSPTDVIIKNENSGGLNLRDAISKYPSFRKNVTTCALALNESPHRKSIFDSEDDSFPSSDDKVVSQKSKPVFDLSSLDDDDYSTDSSEPIVRESVTHIIADSETISTTDESCVDKMVQQMAEDSQSSVKTSEFEDILSDDDSPEVKVKSSEEDEGKTQGININKLGQVFKKQSPGEAKLTAVNKHVLTGNGYVTGAVTMKPMNYEVEEGEIREQEEEPTAMRCGIHPEDIEMIDSDSELVSKIEADNDHDRGQSAYKNSSKPKAFSSRFGHDRLKIMYEFLEKGLDIEDIKYFKKSYQELKCDDTLSSLSFIDWVDHPETAIKKSRKQKRSKHEYEEGSLRTRSFVRMTKEEKSHVMVGQQRFVQMSYDGSLPGGRQIPKEKARETQMREAKYDQRRLQTILGKESDLLKINHLYFRKKTLKFSRSKIHDWGLFAGEPIVAADEMITEYVGEVIRSIVADLRETKYENQGIGSSYFFRIDPDTIIDATTCGNFSRFINHSCNPNCYAKVITVDGKRRVVIYSKQPIAVGEEITYDYKFPIEDKKIPCMCGTPHCRGTLN